MRDEAGLDVRLREMLIGWGSVGIVYSLSHALQGAGRVLPETALDRLIAFNPAGIWLYLSFFVFIPYTYLTVQASKLRWLRQSMQVCALVSGAVFLLWPTTLPYPDYAGYLLASADRWSAALLRLLLWGDSPQNCLPSLHAGLTVLCAWALLDRQRPWRSALAVLAVVCICFSIVQLRRHLSIDVGAGLLAGIASGALCRWLARDADASHAPHGKITT